MNLNVTVLSREEIEDRITHARVDMLFNMPFFGELALRLKVVDGSGWVPTLGTDGKHFYYNRDFISSLSREELQFGFGHEVLHCVYDHLGARGSRDHRLWNLANDFVINLELDENKCGKLIQRQPRFKGDPLACIPCFDMKYANMSSDQVYELLKEEQDKNQDKFSNFQFDIHLDDNGQPCENQDGRPIESDPTGLNGPIPLSSEERSRIKSDTIKAVIDAAQNASASGKVPAGVLRLVKSLIEPKMNWKEYINSAIQSLVRDDYSFVKPSRRTSSFGGRYVLPGFNNATKINVLCAIDTSGSVGEHMVTDFVSEVRGILNQFEDYDLHLMCFDAKAYDVYHFTPDNKDDIFSFKINGGGGTLFESVWDKMEEEDLEPEQVIVLTDGYPCSDWIKSGYSGDNVIYLIHGAPNITAPVGVTLHYE